MSGKTENLKDVLAIVKFEEQTLLASLDTSSYETWIKQLSDLTAVPVEAHLIPKGHSISDAGVEIKDARSFAKVLAAVEEARQTKDVLKLVLYPSKTIVGLEKAIQKIDTNKEGSQPKSLLLAVQKGAVMPKSPENCQACEECPKWAAQIKKELLCVIEDKFTTLASQIDEKLSQMSQNTSYAESVSSMKSDVLSAGSRFSGSGRFKGLHVVPRMNEQDRNKQPDDQEEMTRSRVDAADQELQAALAVLRAQNDENLESVNPKIDAVERELAEMEAGHTASPSKKSTGSAGSSVVVVSSPGSSFVELDDAKTVGNGSIASLEIVNTDQFIATDEVDETGSVVYVETDDEEEEGHDFTLLKSWASSRSMSGSQVATPMNASTTSVGSSLVQSVSLPNSPPSLQASFHSAGSELSVQQAIVADAPIPTISVQGNAVPKAFSQEEEVKVEEVQNDQGGASRPPATPERAVSINGSSQLPVDLNAMRSVESQEIFSPNSDIGTKFLSAASTIANAFMQSMETLSKTLGEVEAKTRASVEKRNSQTNQEPIEMEQVQPTAPTDPGSSSAATAKNNGNPSGEVAQEEAQEEVQVAEASEQRGRGRREPPKADGPMMSREELDWYLAEYGLDHFGNHLWEQNNGAVDRQAFNKFVIEYFDGLEDQ